MQPVTKTIGPVLLALSIASLPALAQGGATIEVGGVTLQRVSQATRSEMLGLVDIYSVGLFLPPGKRGPEAIFRSGVPKALRVEVLYGGSAPGRIPEGWREELMPALSEEQERTLRQAYSTLGGGDQLRVTYAPGSGTTLMLNGRQVLHDPGYGLMAAFLDVWLGQTPVSEEVKQKLLGIG